MSLAIMSMIAAGAAGVGVIFMQLRPVVLPMLANDAVTRLNFSPTKLLLRDTILVIILMLVKTLASSLGLWRSHRLESQPGRSSEVELAIPGPRLTVEMPLKLDMSDLRRFELAMGSERLDIGNNPALIMLFLSAATEPAMLLLLGKRRCRIKALGSVNVRNQFDIVEPNLCKKLVALRLDQLVVRSTLSQLARVARRGYEYDLAVEVFHGERRTPVFRQTFTMLEFAKHGHAAIARDKDALGPKRHELTAGPSFDMTLRDPSLWAALCKDYNPIHISSVGAKVFGMPGVIAHGNHVAAKALRALPPFEDFDRPSRLTVEFRRPAPLPSTMDVYYARTSSHGEAVFEISRGDKLLVTGRFEVS